MPRIPVQFAAQTYQPRSPFSSKERLLNMYIEAMPPNNEDPAVLYGTPGLKPFTTVGDGPIRGMHEAFGKLWVASGDRVYSVETNGTVTDRGFIGGAGNVLMENNAFHVAVLTGTKSYAVNVSEIVELPEPAFNGVTYQDGYTIFTQAGTEFLWISALDDMTTINPLDFTSADVFPDNVVGVVSDHREVWVFGRDSIEVFQNTGAAAFPFERSQFLERGCIASQSIEKDDNAVLWLADDRRVYRADGYVPQRISTGPIERLIENTVSPESAFGYVYDQDGHKFYVLNFSDLSIIYDLSTGLWHERQSYLKSRWRANGHAEFAGNQYVGDFETNQLYELDLETYDEDGEQIIREMIAPVIAPKKFRGEPSRRVFMHEFGVEVEAGVGLNLGQGSDPTWVLDWTDDGCHRFDGGLERTGGKIGEYGTLVCWNRLGSFYRRSMRLRMTDPVKTVVLSAYADIEVGDA